MTRSDHVAKPELERTGRRLGRPSVPFLLVASALAVLGAILMIVGSSWVWAIGIVLVALSGPPTVVGMALLAASAVARWAARDRPFA
ncbi:MAG TPA: hypothetical protein VHW04_05525 [Solirubrobacteraceae bacterium]|jgi:hypothetical protein|nr:hypothetical protein [Solirubrobacteraceae bacterium]